MSSLGHAHFEFKLDADIWRAKQLQIVLLYCSPNGLVHITLLASAHTHVTGKHVGRHVCKRTHVLGDTDSQKYRSGLVSESEPKLELKIQIYKWKENTLRLNAAPFFNRGGND